jgi:CheY-like chemotaxis protein
MNQTPISHPESLAVLRGLRIVLIDDEPTVLRALTMLLQALDAKPYPFSTPSSALEFLAIEASNQSKVAEAGLATTDTPEIDLILSDLRMPGLNGLELLKQIRGSGVTVPFILMSGHATGTEAAETEKAGRTAFVSKPFTPPQLASAVHRVLPDISTRGLQLLARKGNPG